ncbi:MAG TPA: hypothetical protein VK844_02060, partial [Hyphomicrobiales bacterium]|nr:hypothetical protein [Hyphomicrobiales bacterium]
AVSAIQAKTIMSIAVSVTGGKAIWPENARNVRIEHAKRGTGTPYHAFLSCVGRVWQNSITVR